MLEHLPVEDDVETTNAKDCCALESLGATWTIRWRGERLQAHSALGLKYVRLKCRVSGAASAP